MTRPSCCRTSLSVLDSTPEYVTCCASPPVCEVVGIVAWYPQAIPENDLYGWLTSRKTFLHWNSPMSVLAVQGGVMYWATFPMALEGALSTATPLGLPSRVKAYPFRPSL